MKKVLSVDFDYFIKATKLELQSFPDGVDLPTDISTFVWGTHYAYDKDLPNIGIYEDELKTLRKVLRNQLPDVPVLVTNSHLHVYEFIHDYVDIDDKLRLINIDMHHDMFNDNETVDCGNWVSHICKEYKCNFNWITNPVSLDTYGFNKVNQEDLNVLTSISDIEDEKFDLIFLCRSDNWFPPHLDKYFVSICGTIKRHFEDVTFEKGINKARNYQQYAELDFHTKEIMSINNIANGKVNV